MSEIRFSVITPTFNRAHTLRRMLQHLFTVDGIMHGEVIVVNDGSNDDTADVLAKFQREYASVLKVIKLSNGGPARARNAGVNAALYERLLFIDDDVFPRRDMLRHHWEKLERGYDGSQGFLAWHQEIAITPLIRYIDSRGSQFDFDQIDQPEELTGKHIYTGNFAVSKEVIRQGGGFCEKLFDKELAFSAFEDTVMGCAIKRKGAKLGFTRSAVADHLHHMTEKSFLRREYNVGSGTARLQQEFPQITSDLNLGKRSKVIGVQVFLLTLLNALPGSNTGFVYSFRMRLRHREAFLRGYLHYERRARLQRGEVRE